MVALRKESAITEHSFVSTWSGKTYTGWYLDGRMVGCSCPYHAARPHVACKHMSQYNSAMQAITGQDLQQHLEDGLRTRFNAELWRKETYCHGHWWGNGYCHYGAHYLD